MLSSPKPGSLDLFKANLDALGVEHKPISEDPNRTKNQKAKFVVDTSTGKSTVYISDKAIQTGKIGGSEIHELVHVYSHLITHEGYRGHNHFPVAIDGTIHFSQDSLEGLSPEDIPLATNTAFDEPLAYVTGIHYNKNNNKKWKDEVDSQYMSLHLQLISQPSLLKAFQITLEKVLKGKLGSLPQQPGYSVTFSEGEKKIHFFLVPSHSDQSRVKLLILLDLGDIRSTLLITDEHGYDNSDQSFTKILTKIINNKAILKHIERTTLAIDLLFDEFLDTDTPDFDHIQSELEKLFPPILFKGY